MATETEIERLVVRLTGDGSAFQKTIQQAQTSIQGFAANTLKLLGNFGVAGTLKGAVDSYLEAERATMRLNSAIEANGRTVAEAMKEYDPFISQITKLTLTTRGSVVSMLQHAESMGFSGEKAQEVVKTSIALAALRGGEAQSYLRVADSIQRGHTELARHALGLRGVKSETELLNEVNKRLAAGLKLAQDETNSAWGQFQKLQRSLKGLSKEVGEIIVKAIQPAVEVISKAIDAFKDLDPSIKQTAVAALTLFTVISSFGAITRLLAPLAALFSPAAIAIRIFIGLVLYAVQQLGGISVVWEAIKDAAGEAWNWITEKTNEFLEWVQPITDAVASLWNTAWEAIKGGATDLWNWIKEVFTAVYNLIANIFDDLGIRISIDWDKIREDIQTAILAAEFTIKNFGVVWDHVITGAAYALVRLSNEAEYFFNVVMVESLDWLITNWSDIWTDIGNIATATFGHLADNIVKFFSNLPGLIAGTVKFSDIWTPLLDGFQRVSKQLVIPDREIGALELQLKEEFEKEGAALGQSFEEFRKKKLAEFAGKRDLDWFPEDDVDKAKKEALKLGSGIGSALKKGIDHQKIDAVLSRSAEAATRIAAQRELLGTSISSGTAIRPDANTPILQDIKVALIDSLKGPKVNIDVANLA